MQFLIVFALIVVSTNAGGPTEPCPEICPDIFTPVCANDGQEIRTFSNECYMEAYNCRSGDGKNIRSF